ncbi:MAG: pyridoxamine 5'-phosphate oxidase family protein [Candidatus Kariarchaeaceae archaeon]|jgi:nitroimidazol reductase NimA-like FMN-containing flavoprotein (pyridoxamine 5'-phosphate oxidase superfamily)
MRDIRRKEKAITDENELKRILRETKYITIAMCSDNQPYLVTLSHGYDSQSDSIYFHCASAGKKVEILTKNPFIWGQAVNDLGYENGECNHHFESVHFKGKVTFLTNMDDKKQALSIMIDQLETIPELKEKVKIEQIKDKSVQKVTIGKIKISEKRGKKG